MVLQFRTLTLAPLDLNLINFQMLTRPEREWLVEYHAQILKNFTGQLDHENLAWLQLILNKIQGEK